jgi:hypothetical protein
MRNISIELELIKKLNSSPKERINNPKDSPAKLSS